MSGVSTEAQCEGVQPLYLLISKNQEAGFINDEAGVILE